MAGREKLAMTPRAPKARSMKDGIPSAASVVRKVPEAKRMKASAAARKLVPERSTAVGREPDNSVPCIGAEIRCELSAQWRAARTRKAPDAPKLPPQR